MPVLESYGLCALTVNPGREWTEFAKPAPVVFAEEEIERRGVGLSSLQVGAESAGRPFALSWRGDIFSRVAM